MLNDLSSGPVERQARYRRVALGNICTADAIRLVSAWTHGYVCTLAYASRREMACRVVGFRLSRPRTVERA
jgi:hypothetical protein